MPPGRAALAYFLTFTTYGTRLHGDPRGTVDRRHNQYGEGHLRPKASWAWMDFQRLAAPEFRMAEAQRNCVSRAFGEVCEHRGWILLALNVRTNHVHVLVAAEHPIELVLNLLKVWATRRLREEGLISRDARVWAQHGSTKYLFDREALVRVKAYIVDGQGGDLPGAVEQPDWVE